LLLLTPRTSWWASTAERAGGILAWLEALRALAAIPARRRAVVALATCGHELGHIGAHRAFAAEPALAAAGSAPYLGMFGTVTGGWLMARLALAARARGGDFAAAKLATARFYAEHFLARAPAYLPAITGGATVLDFDPDWL
jgi:hypothetical protein